MKLVLDTNTFTDYAEGIPQTVEFMASHGEQLFLPSVVLGELYYGCMKGRRQRFNEEKLHQFISRLKVGTIEVSANVARKYATIYVALRRKGTKIPINDVWIAACCMEVGGVLLTRDRHFEVIDQIETVVLPQVSD